MAADPPPYVVRSYTPVSNRADRVTFVDRHGRLMHVTVQRRYALAGGTHAAIMERIRLAGAPKRPPA